MTQSADMTPGEPDMTAAEFALGVLDGQEHRAAAARLSADAGFASEVADWEARLAPLAAEIAPVTPPPGVWDKIAAQIGASGGVWNSLPFWRGATIAAAAAAVVAFAFVAGPMRPSPVAPAGEQLLVAKLAPAPDKAPTVVATLDINTRELVLTPVNLDPDISDQQSAELWVIPEGQKAISLGVMDDNKPHRIPMPPQFEGEGRFTALLAINAEQPGGSPTGQAQGPVVAVGNFSQG